MNNKVGITGLSGNYIRTVIAGESYWIDSSMVRKIVFMDGIKSLPKTPYFLKDVIYLADHVIPVIDLQKQLKLRPATVEGIWIVVVQCGGSPLTGLIVDSVNEVLSISDYQVEASTGFSPSENIVIRVKVPSGLMRIIVIDEVIGGARRAATADVGCEFGGAEAMIAEPAAPNYPNNIRG